MEICFYGESRKMMMWLEIFYLMLRMFEWTLCDAK